MSIPTLTFIEIRPRQVAALLVLLAVGAAASAAAQTAGGAPEIATLSNRADMVSGGDVLVRVTPAPGRPGRRADGAGRPAAT